MHVEMSLVPGFLHSAYSTITPPQAPGTLPPDAYPQLVDIFYQSCSRTSLIVTDYPSNQIPMPAVGDSRAETCPAIAIRSFRQAHATYMQGQARRYNY
jgi:hypothetical protein